MNKYDAIVIGAGHNGLTTAALLGQAGRSVLVLERRDVVGGLAASEEFHPGYRSAGVLSDTGLVRGRVISKLGLEKHGLKLRSAPPSVLALGNGEGEPLLIDGREDRAAAAIGRVSAKDGKRYPEYRAFLARIAPALEELFDRPAIDLVDIESESLWDLGKRGLRVRRLGKDDLMELLRLPPMCVADVLGEYFESDLLQAALALPALEGTFTGPWSPGNAINLLRRECLGGPGVEGSGPALVAALHNAALAAGVEIRTGAAVASLRLGSQGVTGVTLEDGETIDARVVASSCHPLHTLCTMLPPGAIEHRLEHRLRSIRNRGSVSQVLLACRRPPRFGADGVEFARTGAHVDDLERAFDAIKYGEVSPTPILDIHVASQGDATLAPKGHAVVSVLVYFTPYALKGGWTDAARDAVGEQVVQLLARHDAELPEHVVGRQVLTPVDLEARYGLPGGHLFHGEHSLDQLMIRPTPECIHHDTPIPGLFVCGSGSHPGGGLSCAPGELAARAISGRKAR
ncbi:MAG: NAD(P)/FAD-dependent oxidoreductase [Myxococcota bacterium]